MKFKKFKFEQKVEMADGWTIMELIGCAMQLNLAQPKNISKCQISFIDGNNDCLV